MRTRGFTIIEVMVAIVIVGLVSAFAIPNYAKAVDKTLARDMVNNLRIIAAGQEAYRASGFTYFGLSGGSSDQANLNQYLGLKVISQKGVLYSCQVNQADTANGCVCTAVYPGRFTYDISTSTTIIPKWSQITCAGSCPVGVP